MKKNILIFYTFFCFFNAIAQKISFSQLNDTGYICNQINLEHLCPKAEYADVVRWIIKYNSKIVFKNNFKKSNDQYTVFIIESRTGEYWDDTSFDKTTLDSSFFSVLIYKKESNNYLLVNKKRAIKEIFLQTDFSSAFVKVIGQNSYGLVLTTTQWVTGGSTFDYTYIFDLETIEELMHFCSLASNEGNATYDLYNHSSKFYFIKSKKKYWDLKLVCEGTNEQLKNVKSTEIYYYDPLKKYYTNSLEQK